MLVISPFVAQAHDIAAKIFLQARNFIQPDELFTIEPPEAVERLVCALRVCSEFKSTYFEYNAKASVECPANPCVFSS